jgi:hypothetical protein
MTAWTTNNRVAEDSIFGSVDSLQFARRSLFRRVHCLAPAATRPLASSSRDAGSGTAAAALVTMPRFRPPLGGAFPGSSFIGTSVLVRIFPANAELVSGIAESPAFQCSPAPSPDPTSTITTEESSEVISGGI